MSLKHIPPVEEPTAYAGNMDAMGPVGGAAEMVSSRATAASGRAAAAAPVDLRDLVAQVAMHEWLLVGYLTWLFLLAATATTPGTGSGMLHTGTNLALAVVALGIVRTQLFGNQRLEAVIARTVILVCLGASFYQLAELFGLRAAPNLDEGLLRLDLSVFGFEPSLLADRFITPALVEWFSFFYFGYYFLLFLHIIPIGYFSRDNRLVHEFALGIVMTFSIGHLLYFAVPGLGPFSLPVFVHRMQGGYWWGLVSNTVHSAGARKDIFPSLHTAVPTFLTLFSFRNRARAPFRYTWPLVGAFTSQIILATMFLRWHYVIDVIAGLTLAVCTSTAAARLSRWERSRREADGLTLAMPPYSEQA